MGLSWAKIQNSVSSASIHPTPQGSENPQTYWALLPKFCKMKAYKEV
jgi:hypothetical protein